VKTFDSQEGNSRGEEQAVTSSLKKLGNRKGYAIPFIPAPSCPLAAVSARVVQLRLLQKQIVLLYKKFAFPVQQTKFYNFLSLKMLASDES
jgi:hypothetical protein